jgi:thymidylate synthase
MRTYRGETFADVYEIVLRDVLKNPEYETAPRGMKIKEVTNAALIIEDPAECLYENERRSSQFKYIAAELVWYFTGRKDTKFIEPFAKFWKHIENEDGSVNSAYGNLIFTERNEYNKTQWEWALNSLIQDKDSRQALLHFNKPKHQYDGNKDFVCTLTGVFHIRENRLNFTIDMRSNDLVLGTPTDIAFFCLLQQQMLVLLKPYYPELSLGTYTHHVHSLHIYEKHFGVIKEMLKKPFESMSFPEIQESLIDESGNPVNDLKLLEAEIIANDHTIKYDDNLLCWISEAIFENI